MVQQSFADGVARAAALAQRVDIADDGLLALVDTEGVADDTAFVQRDEAGKDAAVEIFEQQLCGCLLYTSRCV